MGRRENKDYGKIIDYDPQWSGPLKIERNATDLGFLISLGVYFAVWIAVGIYAFCTGEIKIDGKNHAVTTTRSHSDGIPASGGSAINIALAFIVVGIVLCFLFLFLLRHFPKAVVFTAIFVYLAILLAVICMSAYQLVKHTKTEGTSPLYQLIVTIIVFVVTIIFLIVYRKKVVIACGVVKESTKAVFFFPSAFLFPILPIILYGITLAFSGFTYVYLSANPSMQGKNSAVHIYLLHGINIFGLLWLLNFIYAFTQMVLSGTFATWYWTMDKDRVASHVILRFLHITTRFHLGTLAFGSLIIAIIQAIKLLAKAAAKRSRESGDNIGALLLSCLGAIFETIEDALEYINTNAYIMCTIHGTNFIQSAKDAFNLLMRNVLNVVAVTQVTGMILVLGELVVVGLTVMGTYLWTKNGPEDAMYTAMIIVGVSTLAISISVFEILKTAINTIFLCVLEDYERNDGSSERPYYMTDKMRRLLLDDE